MSTNEISLAGNPWESRPGCRSPGRIRGLLFLAGLLPVLGLARVSMAQEVEEEDLPDSAFAQEIPYDRLRERFRQAEEAFGSADQASSGPVFGEIIEALESAAQAQTLGSEGTDLLISSYSYRASVRFNFNDQLGAEEDLQRLVNLKPAHDLDRSLISPKLGALFDRVKDRLVGYLEMVVEPLDATVTVDGVPVDPYAGPVAVLAGRRWIRGERIGFAPVDQEMEVPGGRTEPLTLTLERSGPVLVLHVRPAGASIIVDGKHWGAAPDRATDGVGAANPAEVLIGDLDLGTHRVEVRKDGYRNFAGKIETPEARDYNIQPIVLERAVGAVILDGLPAGAEIRANGAFVEPDPSAPVASQLSLRPGEYLISVSQGKIGVFEATVRVVDQRTTNLEVVLRPAVVFLGVLGGDEVGGRKLHQRLSEELGKLPSWTLLDRSQQGPGILNRLGVGTDQLRVLAEEDQARAQPFDWASLQTAADREIPGAVYLLAVLSDDLLAKDADLWIWPAAPAPPQPDRKRISLEDRDALARMAAAFSPSIGDPRPSLGLLLIDSGAATAPVVAHLTPGGPAEQAGIQLGDEISAIADTPAFTVAQVQDHLATLVPGTSVAVEVTSAKGSRTVTVRLGASPRTVDLIDPSLIYPAVSAEIAAALSRGETQTPRWVLELNQAAVLLHGGAYEQAVRVLRRIEAPTAPGLGRAAVLYWLGIALAKVGPSYTDDARDAFSQAAEAAGGRLFHNDGPWLGPRARARLIALGVSSQ